MFNLKWGEVKTNRNFGIEKAHQSWDRALVMFYK